MVSPLEYVKNFDFSELSNEIDSYEQASGEGVLSQILGAFSKRISPITDFPQGIGMSDEEFARVKELNPARTQSTMRKPFSTGEKIGNFVGSVGPVALMEAASLVATGGASAIPSLFGHVASETVPTLGAVGGAAGLSVGLDTAARMSEEPELSPLDVLIEAGKAAGFAVALPLIGSRVGPLFRQLGEGASRAQRLKDLRRIRAGREELRAGREELVDIAGPLFRPNPDFPDMGLGGRPQTDLNFNQIFDTPAAAPRAARSKISNTGDLIRANAREAKRAAAEARKSPFPQKDLRRPQELNARPLGAVTTEQGFNFEGQPRFQIENPFRAPARAATMSPEVRQMAHEAAARGDIPFTGEGGILTPEDFFLEDPARMSVVQRLLRNRRAPETSVPASRQLGPGREGFLNDPSHVPIEDQLFQENFARTSSDGTAEDLIGSLGGDPAAATRNAAREAERSAALKLAVAEEQEAIRVARGQVRQILLRAGLPGADADAAVKALQSLHFKYGDELGLRGDFALLGETDTVTRRMAAFFRSLDKCH